MERVSCLAALLALAPSFPNSQVLAQGTDTLIEAILSELQGKRLNTKSGIKLLNDLAKRGPKGEAALEVLLDADFYTTKISKNPALKDGVFAKECTALWPCSR